MNSAKNLGPYAAGVAFFSRLLGRGASGIFQRQATTTVVVCPPIKLPAEVGVDHDLRMESCSRWPEQQNCSQSCLPQVHFSAEELNDFATHYEGKSCAACDAALTRDDWYRSRLAAVETATGTPSGVARSSSVSTPKTCDPICSTCYATPKS